MMSLVVTSGAPPGNETGNREAGARPGCQNRKGKRSAAAAVDGGKRAEKIAGTQNERDDVIDYS